MRGGTKTISRARSLRQTPTEAERRLWNDLRDDKLGWSFRRQHAVPPYFADFACVAARLIVEVDGGQHGTPRDDARDEFLRRQGWRVLRFWNNDVLRNRDGVLETIVAALPPPRPSPAPRKRERSGAPSSTPLSREAGEGRGGG